MTEAEMRQRIKEIDEERDKLSNEKRQYEKVLMDSKLKKVMDEHKNYIGKCFISKGSKANRNDFVKVFKVLDILDTPNEQYALCLVLLDGYRYTCFKEYGIQIMTLHLWGFNEPRMMNKAEDSRFIDFYKEISEEKFEELYLEYSNELSDKFFKN